MAWYAAKCLFLHRDLSRRQGRPCYEERITLVRAAGERAAVRKGEAEARRYARAVGKAAYLGFISVFALSEKTLKDGTELYSILRSIDLPGKDFLARHYDDGTFHARALR